MKNFSFQITRDGKRIIAGSVSAPDMESAVTKLMSTNNITVKEVGDYVPPMYDFMKDGKRVNLAIYASPEYHL